MRRSSPWLVSARAPLQLPLPSSSSSLLLLRREQASGKEDGEAKPAKKAKKEEDKEGFFKADASKNPNVYVQGLPTDDFDDEAFVTFMSRCGIVMQGQDGACVCSSARIGGWADSGKERGEG